MNKNYTKLQKKMICFLGHAMKQGASKEEIEVIVTCIGLLGRYPLASKKKEK